MKALSIRQPWAWAIMHAGKDIENRDWNFVPRYRGPLLIHASSGMSKREYLDGRAFVSGRTAAKMPVMADLPIAGIVGVVDLIDAFAVHREPYSSSPWFVGPVGLVLANPRPCKLIRMPGQLSIFDTSIEMGNLEFL